MATATIEELRGTLYADIQDLGGTLTSQPLWPAPYDEDTPESAWAFCLKCWTWNEAEKAEQPLPDEAYLKALVWKWFKCKKSGRTLIIEKCRRMVVSWLARCLELHEMGLSRSDQILAGEDLEAAAKHVWRFKFLYEGLRRRNPSWELESHSELKYEGEKKLKSFTLPNGSTCSYANGQATGLQGDGVSRVTMEEAGIYRYLASMLAQAKIITKGSALAIGGAVVLITNASTNADWQRVKAPDGDRRAGTEVVRGLEEKDLKSGALYLKLHHYADPNKDDEWLEAVRLEMLDTPFEYEREILMKDSQAKGALWKTEWFHRFGFRYPACLLKSADVATVNNPSGVYAVIPDDIVKLVVAIDPNVVDATTGAAKKNPNELPDECGLLAVGVTEDKRAVVLADLSDVMDTEDWAKKAVKLARIIGATEIWYEANNGGDLIRNTISPYLHTFPDLGDEPLKIRPVNAKQGKRARAEPCAVRYELGRSHHAGHLSALETQLVNWDASNPSAPSPGRVDALAVAFHALRLAEFKNATSHKRTSQRKHD